MKVDKSMVHTLDVYTLGISDDYSGLFLQQQTL
jgi:hypothetical protein